MTFDLSKIKPTRSDMPPRTVIYGPHKIGKSTFASQAPAPIFLQTEDGLGAIDTSAFPLCQSWGALLECVTSLYQEDHKYKTVVLDSADWAEKLAHQQVCETEKVKSLEKIGYGKGYAFAADLFAELLSGFDALRKKGMGVVVLAHAEIKRFDDPLADAYDRYQIKLHKTVSKTIQEWADVISFAQLATITKTEAVGFDGKRTRAISTGQRVLNLVGSASFDAGNRYGMPDTISLDWPAYEAALTESRKQPTKQDK